MKKNTKLLHLEHLELCRCGSLPTRKWLNATCEERCNNEAVTFVTEAQLLNFVNLIGLCRCGTLPTRKWLNVTCEKRCNNEVVTFVTEAQLLNFVNLIGLCRCGEMVDAHVSGACEETHKGSSPFIGNYFYKNIFCDNIIFVDNWIKICRRGTLPTRK